MAPREIVSALIVWTPFLAIGFLWNILISMVAMAIGTGLGAGLAVLRLSNRPVAVRASALATELTRNTPTFVFQFYLAFVVPTEIEIGGAIYTFPVWFKASLALSIAVAGFVSDNFSIALRQWRAGDRGAALLFVPSWTSYFLIIVMASSAASVIGVSELVSRCNTVIAAVGSSSLMLWIYLYAMLWFFAFCFPLNHLMRLVRRRLARRIDRSRNERGAEDERADPNRPDSRRGKITNHDAQSGDALSRN